MKKLEDIACPLLEAFVLAAKSDVSAVVGKTRRNYRNVNDEGKTAAHYLSKSAIDRVSNNIFVSNVRLVPSKASRFGRASFALVHFVNDCNIDCNNLPAICPFRPTRE